MLTIFMQIALMGQKHGTPKDLPANQWYYPVERVEVKKGSLRLEADAGKVFGEPAIFRGQCMNSEGVVLKKENCTIYYRTDITDVKGGILKFMVRGKGKFRISVYSPLGYTMKTITLKGEPVEVSIDLSKSIAITQHGSAGPLRIVFTPLENGKFVLEVSNFVLEQEE